MINVIGKTLLRVESLGKQECTLIAKTYSSKNLKEDWN